MRTVKEASIYSGLSTYYINKYKDDGTLSYKNERFNIEQLDDLKIKEIKRKRKYKKELGNGLTSNDKHYIMYAFQKIVSDEDISNEELIKANNYVLQHLNITNDNIDDARIIIKMYVYIMKRKINYDDLDKYLYSNKNNFN